jgi:dUTP pyrophosphatase
MNSQIEIEIRLLDGRVIPPMYATDGSNACDLKACITAPIYIQPNQLIKVPTGLSIYIKDFRYAALLLPKSGFSTKLGIKLGNDVGLIDSDYQGEIIVSLKNEGDQAQKIRHGDRIAQMLFLPTLRPQFNIVDEFSLITDRGAGGFGSTGK